MEEQGKRGHGFTPGLGSRGGDARDEQEGWTLSHASPPTPCSTVGKQLVLAVIHVGPLEGFKLMIVLSDLHLRKSSLGPGLGAVELGEALVLLRRYPLLHPTGAGLQSRGVTGSTPWPPGALCFSSLIRLSIASAQQNTKCADEITALRAEGQS